jgi:two-component system OmpR family response regulator
MAGGRRRVLVIEDDPETAEQLVESLSTSGYQVDLAVNGDEGLDRGRSADYAVMTIDRMLPGIDGIGLVQALRATSVKAPVLFLTALGGVGDRVRGLEAGGDDYLTKPFAFAELLARINALARRPPLSEAQTVLRVGDLELDLLKRTVLRDGKPVELQPREFQLLAFLMRNAERVVTRTMLLEAIWDFHFDPKTNIVETHMSRLRAKLSEHGGADLIHTVRGAGYALRAPVSGPP